MSNLAYQEEITTEMLNGKMVAMSPRPFVNHNVISGKIFNIFENYLKGKTCITFSDGVDVYLTEKDRVVPDVMIVCNRDIIKKNGIHGTPDLIVEVLSPSTAKRDKGYKKDLYEKCGVKEYWIVEAETRSVEIYLLQDGSFILSEIYAIFPDYMIEKMTEEEKNNLVYEFKTSLYADLTIALEDIFGVLF